MQNDARIRKVSSYRMRLIHAQSRLKPCKLLREVRELREHGILLPVVPKTRGVSNNILSGSEHIEPDRSF